MSKDPRASLFCFPTAVRHDPAVDAWLRAQRDELRALAEPWVAHLRRCGDDVRELIHDGRPTACVEDAAFAYVAAYREHVGVGLFFGTSIDDPAKLLEGTGKHGRHVKLRPNHPIDRDALGRLVDAAYADMRRRLAG